MAKPLSFFLDPAVKHAAVVREVDRLWKGIEVSEAALCLGLSRLFRDNLHRGRSRTRFEDWAHDRFQIPKKLLSIFKWIGGMLSRLPKTLEAMQKGEIRYTKVREFVNLATPENEAEWLHFALTKTSRQLEARVRRQEAAAGIATTKVVSRLTPVERQAVRRAREVLQQKKGKKIPPRHLLAEMATAIADGELLGAGEEGKKPRKPPVYVSIQPCPICLNTYIAVPEGLLEVPMQEWIQAVKAGAEVVDQTGHFFCDCTGEKHRKDECPNWKLPQVEFSGSRYIPAWVEKIVRARDGMVCRMPGCASDGPLHNSHLKPFSEGTPAIPETIREHCGGCNGLVESGKIQIVGYAPYERYYDDKGNFLGFAYDRKFRRKKDPKSSHMGTLPEPSEEGDDPRKERPPGDQGAV